MPMIALIPILLVLASGISGTVMDALIKDISIEMSVFTVIAWRYVFGAMIMVMTFLSFKRTKLSWRAVRFHLMRGSIQVVAAIAFFWALTQIALAEATVIGFTAALMVAPLGWLILGERMTKLSAGAAILGFVGALVAMSGEASGAPVDGNRTLGFISVFVSAFCYALTLVLLRLASRTGDSVTTLMFSNIVPAFWMVTALYFLAGPTSEGAIAFFPTGWQWGAVFGLSIIGIVTWGAMTKAYSLAPAQRLAPLDYATLIWSSSIGYLFFKEVPASQLYIGAVIIIISCLIVAYESHFATRRETHMPPSEIPS